MSTTLEQVREFMEASGCTCLCEREQNIVGTLLATELYETPAGDRHLRVMLRLIEDGEYLQIVAPNLYHVPADHPNKAAVHELCLRLAWHYKLIGFEYDHEDGEIRMIIHLPLEDAALTPRQLRRCVDALQKAAEAHACWFRAVLELGSRAVLFSKEVNTLEGLLSALRQQQAELLAAVQEKQSSDADDDADRLRFPVFPG